jgi:nucleolar protein 56
MVKFNRDELLKKAAKKLQQELSSPDYIIIQTINAIDDLNKIANLCYERVFEWYSLHFPEVKIKDPKKYVLLASFFNRANPDKAKLEKYFQAEFSSILNLANNSTGIIFDKNDIEALEDFANFTLTVYEKKEFLENYLKEVVKKQAPNLSYICGEMLAARLIQKAGGIKKLALMPSSTIQVLGAEKALFKHLKTGSPPPKHGIIFQHPLISSTSKKLRGKIARLLSSKIAIVAKADAFSKNFIADKIKNKFEQRLNIILKR